MKRTNQSLTSLGNRVETGCPTGKFEEYDLYVTVAEEDEFLLATNGEEFEEKEMESATISDKGMSAVASWCTMPRNN